MSANASKWLADNLAKVIVALAEASANLQPTQRERSADGPSQTASEQLPGNGTPSA